jgi:hypothetical protein
MKKILEEIVISQENKKKSRLKSFFVRQRDRLKHGPITCPFCKEVFNGLSEIKTHLKCHLR